MAAGATFTKMQGVGNDFVVVDETDWPAGDWATRAVALCDRRFGIGGDGLLVVGRSEAADVRMRMYNPDGTEDMCGNGLRCVIRFAAERGRLGEVGTVETLAGVRSVSHQGGIYSADMGAPRFAPDELPMLVGISPVIDFPLPLFDDDLRVSVVSTGTTHCVAWVDDLPGDERFLRLSPEIENHRLFPERTSVLWTVREAPDRLRLRIWERGVGETLGCGTGACAAAVLARMQGYTTGANTEVVSKGGSLSVHWDGQATDRITLTGPAEVVYTGLWPLS